MDVSTISFEGTRKIFKIPDEIMINPVEILDDQVYRISLGRADYSEVDSVLYFALFDAIDIQLRNSVFLNSIKIITNAKLLTIDHAFVIRTINRYGRFYELEAMKEELVYGDVPKAIVKEKKNAVK